MTEHDHPPAAHDPGDLPGPPESNGLGLAGFIVSLVGLCSGGMLSPVGMILSFVAMFRPPRGFAIAGFVIGLIGSLWIVLAVTVVGFAVLVAIASGLIAGAGPLETTLDAFEVRKALRDYADANAGAWPADASALPGLDADDLQDHWGRPYRIELDEGAGKVRLFSDGPDGQAGTDDDITIS
ncbi:MAG: hypothetical protein D6693_01475, partial [Planctomycetota bacterium]